MTARTESAYDRVVRRRLEPLINDVETISTVIDANLRLREGEGEDWDELYETDGLHNEYDALRAKQRALVAVARHTPLTEAEKGLQQSIEVFTSRADVTFSDISSLPLFDR